MLAVGGDFGPGHPHTLTPPAPHRCAVIVHRDVLSEFSISVYNSVFVNMPSALDCKVYVGDLGSGASKQELEEAFSKYGPLRNVWVARNPPGFAFVEFEDVRDAEDAVRGLDGRTICGRRVRVELSTGKSRGRFRGPPPRRGRPFHPEDRCYECGERGHYARDCYRYSRSRSRSRSPRRKRSYTRSRSRSRDRSRSRTRDHSRSRERSRSRDRSRSRSRSRDRSRSRGGSRSRSQTRERERSRSHDEKGDRSRSRSPGQNGSPREEMNDD
ncbi:serine/arginine-rich splicing factor 3-like isoform X2 [Macrobrachium nipponense]|uniref:serine/arginine-rich splicing factor 3-like isoform X2 n=1 Tax=Macrobrachium nipponense TaxID=159736 RepID=UPI0030C80576